MVWEDEEGAFVGLSPQLMIKSVTESEEQVVEPLISLKVQLQSALSPLSSRQV